MGESLVKAIACRAPHDQYAPITLSGYACWVVDAQPLVMTCDLGIITSTPVKAETGITASGERSPIRDARARRALNPAVAPSLRPRGE